MRLMPTPNNESYIWERNQFKDMAEAFANRQFGANGKGEAYAQKWSYCFHQKMNRLWNDWQAVVKRPTVKARPRKRRQGDEKANKNF